MVGDLCSDLMRDKKFKSLHTEDEQQEFIMIVGNIHEHIQDAIIQLFKEYSGEEVVFAGRGRRGGRMDIIASNQVSTRYGTSKSSTVCGQIRFYPFLIELKATFSYMGR